MTDILHRQSASSLRSELRVDDDEISSSSVPATACRRCRKQKQRCSRDLPICKRCRDLHAVCEYPPPPDRKLLAAKRVATAKARARRESDSSNSTQDRQRASKVSDGVLEFFEVQHAPPSMVSSEVDAGHPFPVQGTLNDPRSSVPQSQAVLRRVTLPSPEVTMFLFEIYFSRLYNSNLLFHKKTFLSQYQANKIPDFVTLSILALASIFLGPSHGHSLNDTDEDGVDVGISMLFASDSTQQGFEWATAASQRVLMQSDIPKIETIQACQNMVLYWFSRGQTDRANIHGLTAYRTGRLLNLHLQKEPSSDADDSALTDEMERRCFWSTWMTLCISQDNANFKANPWQEVIGLPFPSDEESFSSGTPTSTEYFDEVGAVVVMPFKDEKRSPSVMAVFVKLYNLWWEIQNFVKHRDTKSADGSKSIATLLELDHRLGLVFENLHANFRFRNAASFVSPEVDPYRLFSIHILYRLCACTLHTSIVPLFSETPPIPHVSKKMTKLSAEESVKHAAVTLDMASLFITTRPDISRLPSIAGYAMFVACTVHFKSLLAQKKLQYHRMSHFRGAILILERLKDYWTTNQGLWTILKALFADKGINIESISRTDNRQATSADEPQTDLETIVAHKATPPESARTDLYTYIASEEAKAASPHRRPSESSSGARRRSSAQNTPSPGNMTAPLPSQGSTTGEQASHFSADTATSTQQGPSESRTFTLPQHHPHHLHLSTQTQASSSLTQSPLSESHHQPFNTPQPLPLGYGTGNTMILPGRYGPPLDSVAEEEHMNPLGQTPLGPGQAFDHGMELGDFSDLLGTEMEIDGGKLWWDQSYGAAAAFGSTTGVGGGQMMDGGGGGQEGEAQHHQHHTFEPYYFQ